MKKVIIGLALPVSLFVLAACGNGEGEAGSHDNHENHEAHSPVGDIREETSAAHILPVFLTDKHEMLQQTYQAVALNQELLEHIPCYCGCGDTVGHKSSLECFVYQQNEDGSIVWDDHGTKCNVCVEIALRSMVEYNEGKSIAEIRDMIDNSYKEGYPDPTPTPRL
ncbi:PCYCGC motif-containing (lipo)protein [Bacillus horti]|uniref:Lipoprotein n=1 Tax=Caldalkalibacillus horti TaxID=77523 RepID=A0ABT9VZE2_9BACI|nr:PCYCGC motif-containing (lipo)protein [Bacillus horti]MDQ0165975.1 hypothetical protein [Bacillus horti]